VEDEGVLTRTTIEQREVEASVLIYYTPEPPEERVQLFREAQISYLIKGLNQLPHGYQSLDASRPWLCYWTAHSLDLLDALPPFFFSERTYGFLNKCQAPEGGFGGGPGQIAHLAPTYAGVNALMICGMEQAYNLIDRQKMYEYLLSMKTPEGGFTMHKDGEVDVRGTYCALSVASLLNLVTPELTAGAGEYVARCQTFEGGIGGAPGNEAHGGYTFCALAAMVILKKTHLLDMDRLLYWAVNRQMAAEGGFQGRSNKLVDACYSFWQGALFPLIQNIVEDTPASMEKRWLFDQFALQKYVLLACQDPDGGVKDKPGKNRDYYHTCYGLSGLAVSQHDDLNIDTDNVDYNLPKHVSVYGPFQNLLELIHPVYNLRLERVKSAFEHFRKLPLPK